MIPQETVDQIMNAAVIEEVVGDYVELKKSGSSLRGLSPFTNEKTPSFYVLPAKGIFKCFSSGKGGSVVTFLMELEKASYPEALKMLARRYNIEVQEKERTPEEIAAATAKEGLGNLVTWASKWFMDQMRNTDAGKAIGRSYFVERGFRDDVLDTFLIGYSPDSWDALATAAQDADDGGSASPFTAARRRRHTCTQRRRVGQVCRGDVPQSKPARARAERGRGRRATHAQGPCRFDARLLRRQRRRGGRLQGAAAGKLSRSARAKPGDYPARVRDARRRGDARARGVRRQVPAGQTRAQ